MRIPGIGPDVEQAINHTLSLTVLHNAIPIVLVGLIVSSLILALHKPTRAKILLLVGFSLLLFHFEYIKHIMPAIHAQTQLTLTTETPNFRFIWIVDKLINRIVPFGLIISGWGSIIGGIILHRKEKTR